MSEDRTPGAQPAGPAPAPGWSPAAASRRRLRWLLAVIVIMIGLTAGWPLVNMAVSNRADLRPGTKLTVGPGNGNDGQITVGKGWSLRTAESDPRYGISLEHGAISLAVDYVSLVSSPRPSQLWEGLRRLLEVHDPGVRLSRPTAVTSASGYPGMAGTVVGTHQAGRTSIYTDKSRGFAIEMVMLAPRKTARAMFVPGLVIMRSLQLMLAGSQ